jgi:hypothetical protein
MNTPSTSTTAYDTIDEPLLDPFEATEREWRLLAWVMLHCESIVKAMEQNRASSWRDYAKVVIAKANDMRATELERAASPAPTPSGDLPHPFVRDEGTGECRVCGWLDGEGMHSPKSPVSASPAPAPSVQNNLFTGPGYIGPTHEPAVPLAPVSVEVHLGDAVDSRKWTPHQRDLIASAILAGGRFYLPGLTLVAPTSPPAPAPKAPTEGAPPFDAEQLSIDYYEAITSGRMGCYDLEKALKAAHAQGAATRGQQLPEDKVRAVVEAADALLSDHRNVAIRGHDALADALSDLEPHLSPPSSTGGVR